MKCYFCKSEMKQRNPGLGFCDFCAETYQLPYVMTSFDLYNQLLHAWITISNKVRIRLNFKENNTSIVNHSHVFIVPGFPLNPANIKEKIKTYIIFS